MTQVDFSELCKTKTNTELCDIIYDCLKQNDDCFADYEQMIAQMWETSLEEYRKYTKLNVRARNLNEEFLFSSAN